MQQDDLERRVRALEEGAKFDATQAAIREREEEFLLTLRTIKDQMAAEAEGQDGAGIGSSTLVASLQAENDTLKARLAKQEYRIRHLVAGMEKLLEATAMTKSGS
jgi:hypothetical protein